MSELNTRPVDSDRVADPSATEDTSDESIDNAPPAVRRSMAMPVVVAVGVLVLDQLTKWWATETLPGEIIEIAWTLRFRLVSNTGSAFSLGEGMGPWIGVAALAVVGFLLWTGRRITSLPGLIGLGLVLGGALGNILDRLFRSGDGFLGGAVIDFIDFQWWPVFNVADMAVTTGAFLLLLASPRE